MTIEPSLTTTTKMSLLLQTTVNSLKEIAQSSKHH